jgi:hypothetical protein
VAQKDFFEETPDLITLKSLESQPNMTQPFTLPTSAIYKFQPSIIPALWQLCKWDKENKP